MKNKPTVNDKNHCIEAKIVNCKKRRIFSLSFAALDKRVYSIITVYSVYRWEVVEKPQQVQVRFDTS